MASRLFGSTQRFAGFAGRSAFRGQSRNLSGDAHAEEHVALTAAWKWRTYYVAMPIVALASVVNLVTHLSHGHHEPHVPKYSYERKLVKQYPWSPSECNFFDGDCVARVNAAKAGGIVKGH